MAYPVFAIGTKTYDFDFAGSFMFGNSISTSFNKENNKPFYKEEFTLESDSDWCEFKASSHGVGAVESRGDTQTNHDFSCTTIVDGSNGEIRGYFGFSISCDYNPGEERTANLTITHKDGWTCTLKVIQHASKMLSNIEDSDEIIPGTTAWVEIPNKVVNNNLYPDDKFVSNYGKADKIFYFYNLLPYNNPNINVYVPKSKVIESTNIKICYETNEKIDTRLYLDKNDKFCKIIDVKAFDEMLPVTNWKDSSEHSEFKQSLLTLRDFRLFDRDTSSSVLNVYGKIYIVVCDYGEIGKQFVIPFTIIKSTNESKQKFNEIAAKYGSSNYDGTMQNLDWFKFPNTDEGYENCTCCGKPTYHKNNDFCDMCGYNKRKPKVNYNEPYLTIGHNSANSMPVAEYQTGAFIGSGSDSGSINFIKYDYNSSKVGTLVDSMNESLTIEYNLKWLNESTKNPVDINKIFKLSEDNPKTFNELRYIHDDRYPDLDRWEAHLSYSKSYSNSLLNGNDHVAIKLTIKITSTLPDGTAKIYDENTCKNRLDYTYVLYNSNVYDTDEKLKQLKQIYGYENLSPVTPVDPSTPETPDVPEFNGNLEFEKSEVNVPANAHTNVVILNAKGLRKTDLSKLTITSSDSWISNITKTYKTNLKGDAYLWITYNTNNNSGAERSGKLNVSINSKSAVLTINQVAAEDTTTDTSNILLEKPRFNGENNKTTTSSSKESKITLDAFDLTEEDCKKVRVYSNDPWVNISKVTYIKKN